MSLRKTKWVVVLGVWNTELSAIFLRRDLKNLEQSWTCSKDKLYHRKHLVLMYKHTTQMCMSSYNVQYIATVDCDLKYSLNPTAQKARTHPTSFSIN